MNILLLGATGRVGAAVTDIILGNGHQLTVLVRDKNKVQSQNKNLEIVEGDVYDWALLKQICNSEYDVVVNAIVTNPLNSSTLLSDTAVAITSLFGFYEIPVRYIGLTGIAQMKKTFLGRMSVMLSKFTPFNYAVDDQQHAFEIIKSSDLVWSMIACPRLVDDPSPGKFQTSKVFRGGKKKIHPDGVALVVCNQLKQHNSEEVIGVWY